MLGGRVDVMVEPATSAFPRVRAGQVRLLAVSSSGRYPLMPEAPTVEEFVPGIDVHVVARLAMAPKTPAAIVERMNAEVRRALSLPDVQTKLVEGGNLADAIDAGRIPCIGRARDQDLEPRDRGRRDQGGVGAVASQ